MNHADPWLRTALGFIGIDEVTVVAAEGEESAAGPRGLTSEAGLYWRCSLRQVGTALAFLRLQTTRRADEHQRGAQLDSACSPRLVGCNFRD